MTNLFKKYLPNIGKNISKMFAKCLPNIYAKRLPNSWVPSVWQTFAKHLANICQTFEIHQTRRKHFVNK